MSFNKRISLVVTLVSLPLLMSCDDSKNREIPIAATESPAVLNDNFSSDERAQFYHLAEGSEIFPVKWLMALHSSKTHRSFLEDIERFGLIPDPRNPGGLHIGLTQEKSKDLQFASMTMVGVTCSSCHTAKFTFAGKTVLVDGAPGMFDVESFYQELADSASETVMNPGKLVLFLDRYGKLPKDPQLTPAVTRTEAIHPGEFDDTHNFGNQSLAADSSLLFTKGPDGLERLITQRVQFLQRLTKNQTLTGLSGGFGRTDAFGRLRGVVFGEKEMLALDAPVSFPPLWGFANRTWLHWDGNTNSALERNIGQAIGLGATYDPQRNVTTVLIHNLYRLEDLARKIQSPRWPEDVFGKLDPQKVLRGSKLFAANCAVCHDTSPNPGLYSPSELGTDIRRLSNFARPIGGRTFPDALHNTLKGAANAACNCAQPPVSEIQRAAWTDNLNPEWRDTARYVARPLAGVWATPPFLHNGSVPSLEDLLKHANKRPKTFPLGHTDYDPIKVGYTQKVESARATFDTVLPGNSNAGHEFGAELDDNDRSALIEYLKSL